MAEATMDSLTERLERLEAERDVLATLYRYGHSIDYGLEEEWVDCFAQDGVFEVRREEPPGGRHAGHGELRAFVKQHSRAPAHYHKHLLIEPRVEVTGETATVTSYFVRLDRLDGEPIVRSFGRYRDRLVRCDDRAWRFVERIAEVEARHSMSRRPDPYDDEWRAAT
jgi:hypothetical protein